MNNSITEDLKRVVTWQFDKAAHLTGIIDMMIEFAKKSTEDFWDSFVHSLNLNNHNGFGLSMIGVLVGLPNVLSLTDDGYSTLLLNFIKLRNECATYNDYKSFFDSLGIGVKVVEHDSANDLMAVDFIGNTDSDKSKIDLIKTYMPFPTGVRDNNAEGLMFAIPESQTTNLVLYPQAGGLDESSFNWNNEVLEVKHDFI